MPEPGNQAEQPTPRELYEQANQFVTTGDKAQAASLYEKAGYTHQAIKLWEELGDIGKAYQIARASDHYSADRIAKQHGIANHEYFDIPPPTKNEDIIQLMTEGLRSRLGGGTAERLGFHGFTGKVLADVGTRDGRFIPMFRSLGTKEVYGIDPDIPELEKAIQNGLLDKEHAIPTLLENIPHNLKGKFDVASVFNFAIPIATRPSFFNSLSQSLSPTGELVMTVAEREVLMSTLPIARKHFNIHYARLWDGNQDTPHAYLVIGTKIPTK